MPLLTSCGVPAPTAVSRPAEERVTPPAATAIPDGEVACTGDPAQRCLSDVQNADLLRRYEGGERERDRMICWLRVWVGYPACRVD